MRLRTDRSYRFPFDADELWARINRTEHYTNWWPWLRDFDGERLRSGEVWRCAVQPPLPYAVRFTISIDDVVDRHSVAVRVDGDIMGTAQLHVEGATVGSSLRLVADLAPRKQSMQALSIVAGPLVRFGHNWVLDTGARQFSERSSGHPAS